MSKITWKPGTMLAPVPPALISCGTVERPNVMTAAWTGIISSEPPMTYVSIRPSRFSHGLIKDSGEFVINLTTLPLGRSRRLLRRKVRTGHGQVSGDAFDGCSLRKSKSTAGCGKSGLN